MSLQTIWNIFLLNDSFLLTLPNTEACWM